MAQIEESVAQFLNVIESVFGGMAYLIIHHSNYKDRRLRQDRGRRYSKNAMQTSTGLPERPARVRLGKSMSLVFTLASRNLFRDRLRFIASLMGIVFSVVLVMVQMGLYSASAA